jgi:hypothetical protein
LFFKIFRNFVLHLRKTPRESLFLLLRSLTLAFQKPVKFRREEGRKKRERGNEGSREKAQWREGRREGEREGKKEGRREGEREEKGRREEEKGEREGKREGGGRRGETYHIPQSRLEELKRGQVAPLEVKSVLSDGVEPVGGLLGDCFVFEEERV